MEELIGQLSACFWTKGGPDESHVDMEHAKKEPKMSLL